MKATSVIASLLSLRDDAQREVLMRFFKTGKGQYGEGDQFLGIRVPDTRIIAKASVEMPLDSIPTLLTSEWHEVRLCGFLILTYQMEKQCKKRIAATPEAIAQRDRIVQLYLEYADYANNWDLVDLSAPKIIGPWLLLPSGIPDKLAVMDALANSTVLWRQRIAMVSTWKTTQQGHPELAMRYAERLVNHPHDLIHKAVGWMLREVQKRGYNALFEAFLERHAATMPRTALRYAIEQLSPTQRSFWLNKK